MPIYEYKCSECGERFEKWQRSMSCEEAARCLKCGSQRVKRAVSLFATSGSTDGGSLSDSSCAPTTGG
jgi:putative FmdB family regulatory protein